MSAIANRLRKSWDKLKPWASKLEIEAFRLYDRDIPEYPFIIEIFGTSAVLWDRRDDQIDQGKEQNFTDAISGITELGIPREISSSSAASDRRREPRKRRFSRDRGGHRLSHRSRDRPRAENRLRSGRTPFQLRKKIRTMTLGTMKSVTPKSKPNRV
jgi:hypothetical protein